MTPISIGSSVIVDIAQSPRFADCAKAGFDGARGRVIDMAKDDDSPIYRVLPGGRCVPNGVRPGLMRYRVAFDTPKTWPASGAGSFREFRFYGSELKAA